MICFWTLNPIPFIRMSTLMPVPHCLGYCDFTYSVEIESVNSQLFKKDYFRYFGFLVFLFKFYNKHINSCKKKKDSWDFGRDCGKSIDHYCPLKNIEISNP